MHSMTEMIGTLCRTWRAQIALVVAAMAAMAPMLLYADVVTYYHNDLLGSPIIATNATGQVLWQERYGPYGDRQLLQPASANESVFFTSRHEDGNSELVYMGARYYDPMLGRFLSPDPVGFTETNIHSHNRYAYANNNPYRFKDPTGRAPTPIDAAFVLYDAVKLAYTAATDGDVKGAAIDLGISAGAIFLPIPGAALAIKAERAAEAARAGEQAAGLVGRSVTDFVADATIVSNGRVIARGTVDVRETIAGIESGEIAARDVFQNREGLLPQKPLGYYKEYVHPTPGVNGAGPQRIVRGQGGELYYTPNHYDTFTPLN